MARTAMMPRILPTPIPDGPRPSPLAREPVRLPDALLEATLPGPARDRLAAGPVLVVTTGQQPGLFTGPLYTVYKALSAIALAARLEQAGNGSVPVVPVFWVAGDDHDFHEANHATVLNAGGLPVHIVLRTRPVEAPAVPLYREPCGSEAADALRQLVAETPDSEFKAEVVQWLERAYRPEATLADAFAAAMNALLGSRGLAVVRPYAAGVKREMAPWLLRGLPYVLPDGWSPVMIEAGQGRDRLRPEGEGFATRRSGERFARADIERIAREEPERLSPNVLLRPVVEAALWPTVAYVGGPGELAYLPEAGPLYTALGVAPQTPWPRWSGMLVEGRVQRISDKHALRPQEFDAAPGALEGRLVREQLPAEVEEALADLRRELTSAYARLAAGAGRVDATLERTVESARNAALAGTHDIEKKLVAALKRANETLVGQLARARAALFPDGLPQERALTYASMAIRYGPTLLDAIADEVARWATPS